MCICAQVCNDFSRTECCLDLDYSLLYNVYLPTRMIVARSRTDMIKSRNVVKKKQHEFLKIVGFYFGGILIAEI